MELLDNQENDEIISAFENENISNINDLNIDLDKEEPKDILELYNLLEKTKISLRKLREILSRG